MRPRTIMQKEVAASSKQLPSLNKKQQRYAISHCFEHIGRKLKNGTISCLECGHKWMDKEASGKCTCPHCGTKLKIRETRQRTFSQSEYFGIMTTCNGFQVLRYFFVSTTYKVGKKAEYFFSEVVQQWMNGKGKHVTIARQRLCNVMYYDVWNFDSPLEVRAKEIRAYKIYPSAYYRTRKIMPELKQRGFDGSLYNLHPMDMFLPLLSDSKMETILKAHQYSLFRYFATTSQRNADTLWASVKIAIRNRYSIEDASLWCDYIELLAHFGKDLHNAKYVCPTDLRAEHDHYMKKKSEQQEMERIRQRHIKALKDEERFKELKGKFFGIQFSDGEIHIRVLESVEEHLMEGEAMHHCVYGCAYHLRENCLILSATIGGKRIETIEINLKTMEVVQSRGICNQNTKYHKRIIELVNRNKILISSRMAA